MALPWEDRWGVLMPREHPFASREWLTMADLQGQRLIVSTQSHQLATEDDGGIRLYQERGFSVVATYTLLYNASLLVEQGVGLAVCFGGIVYAGEGSPFAFVPLKDREPIPAVLAWKRFQPLSRACELFLHVLRQLVR